MSSVSRAKSCPSSRCRVQYLLIWRLVGLQWRIDHRTQKNPQEQGIYMPSISETLDSHAYLPCLLAPAICVCCVWKSMSRSRERTPLLVADDGKRRRH
ncbi:unnamed protein product [Musa banksii]